MIYEKVIEGKYVDLKSCTEEDAEFTLAIRQDPKFIKYLPKINNTVEQQKAWISYQRKKEGDYFFVVWDKLGNRIGTIGVYDINGEQAEAGRNIILGDSFQAIEASLLLSQFEFYVLKLKCVKAFIFAENKRAIRFNKLFGGIISNIHVDDKQQIKGANGKQIVDCVFLYENFKYVEKKISSALY